ncbi:hypothetical protein GCM10010193_31740 [Kitasatospora atroaurantiaca]|uniref:Uncharacterized protein n=1 Tax=Kitasatospora atroaurantiaca TaxID=285545 RepID=A0A561ERE3_9ACTN|nr:hypothetical protein [Kitasatospora atroaurantiaca]TWE18159.1 hypothetical protein FB465_3209 [Kitasatospora atroaurantiaca]
MPARRLPVTAALLAATALTLTACGSKGAATASSSVTVSDSPTASTASASASPSTSASAAASVPASASGSAPAGGGGCTPRTDLPGHKVIHVVSGDVAAEQLMASATKFSCGPNTPSGGAYTPTGPTVRYSAVTEITADLATLRGVGANLTVPFSRLIEHANDCTDRGAVAEPFSCFGNNYEITVDSAGQITHISELFHP